MTKANGMLRCRGDYKKIIGEREESLANAPKGLYINVARELLQLLKDMILDWTEDMRLARVRINHQRDEDKLKDELIAELRVKLAKYGETT